MVCTPEPFGPRLRALRVAKGLSLSEFARRLYYSKGHVSRIETGATQPSLEFARRCDAELGAEGALAAHLESSGSAHDIGPEPAQDDDGVWIMAMAPDGASSMVPVGRRDMLAGGAALLASLAGHRVRRPATGADQFEYHTRLLASARGLGQVAQPEAVLPMVVGQAQALRVLAQQVRGKDARAVATLSARTAEFAGWMAQEAGDDRMAMWWTGRAAQVAAHVGDQQAATYALVRKALITMYQGDARSTISLARRAQATQGVSARVLSLAAQREAQGRALVGDYDACFRALDTARRHLDVAAAADSSALVIGTSFVPDPVAAVTGWCLYDLGHPAEAAAVLEKEVARIDPGAFRARTRFGIRLALAHAAAGEVDRSCAVAALMLGHATTISSATLRADLRRLSATLRRFSHHPAVRELTPAFAMALHPGTA